ncbi:hypothetical protein ICE94_00015 [Polynucleobacter sp. MWH-Loch1C5]|uniref:hypothetical protein n=1 Tax=Polynucleobacter sp. MWH-Loch1C5 TaxID=2689108 RepID=UPI001C0CA8BE|nr:hypothetical protein [Polynucleobacter sp. MWH-Loch1C5]MBU3541658.1 hypothetical protein [Polynucleobacter sp. MWH-Loch1C5]
MTNDAQLVVLRPDRPPTVERGYEIRLKDDQVNIRPIDKIDQNYQGLGNVIDRVSISLDGGGTRVGYQVSLHDGGLHFKPDNATSASYIEDNRATVIKEGINQMYRRVNDSIDRIRTIFIDFQ